MGHKQSFRQGQEGIGNLGLLDPFKFKSLPKFLSSHLIEGEKWFFDCDSEKIAGRCSECKKAISQ